MQKTALVWIISAGSQAAPGDTAAGGHPPAAGVEAAPRAAIRALLQTARRVHRMAGFRRWQTFRSIAAGHPAADALLVAVDFDSLEALQAALSDGEVRSFCSRAVEWGFTLSPVEILHASFDRQLTQQASVATLLRIGRMDRPIKGAAARDSDLALQAMAAPGSTRLYGARSESGLVALCRIDFDTDDGMWHFLQSPLRKKWSEWAREGYEEEIWALNLPHLEYKRPFHAGQTRLHPLKPQSALSVQFSVSDDRLSACLWLQGRVDSHGSAWCERLCQLLVSDGCRRLEVDVSGLTGISAEALGMLTRTARWLKERGGRFILIDNEERVKRVTRSKHLQSSLR